MQETMKKIDSTHVVEVDNWSHLFPFDVETDNHFFEFLFSAQDY